MAKRKSNAELGTSALDAFLSYEDAPKKKSKKAVKKTAKKTSKKAAKKSIKKVAKSAVKKQVKKAVKKAVKQKQTKSKPVTKYQVTNGSPLPDDKYLKEKQFLKEFIKHGTIITLLKTDLPELYIDPKIYKPRVVCGVENYKILFSKNEPDIGYQRHPYYYKYGETITLNVLDDNTIRMEMTFRNRKYIYKMENKC